MPGIVLKLLFSRAGLTVLAISVLLGLCGYYAFMADLRTAERDDARTEASIARTRLKAQAATAAANIEALETVREKDRERSEFTNEADAAIEAGRASGDGPVAPVLRDTLERVRDRHHAYLSEQRYP